MSLPVITRFFVIGTLLSCFVYDSQSAVVLTKHGLREGRVIARQFERIVVTIMTPDERLFQFYARDVEMVTSAEKNLIGENTILRESASESAEPVAALTRGLEVIVLEEPKEGDWLKVKGWGASEGWIPRSVLTDNVVFTPEEKGILIEPLFDARELNEPASTILGATSNIEFTTLPVEDSNGDAVVPESPSEEKNDDGEETKG